MPLEPSPPQDLLELRGIAGGLDGHAGDGADDPLAGASLLLLPSPPLLAFAQHPSPLPVHDRSIGMSPGVMVFSQDDARGIPQHLHAMRVCTGQHATCCDLRLPGLCAGLYASSTAEIRLACPFLLGAYVGNGLCCMSQNQISSHWPSTFQGQLK